MAEGSQGKNTPPRDDARQMESVPRGVFSSVRNIALDGEPFAEARHLTFGSTVECELATGPKLVFQKTSWGGRQFRLRAADDPSIVFCSAERKGFWRARWELDLTQGPARLESMGFFRSGFLIVSNDDLWGSVDGRGLFKGGWIVTAWNALDPTDLLLIGLVFSRIQKMRAAAAAG